MGKGEGRLVTQKAVPYPISATWKLVKKAESQPPTTAHRIRICILTGFHGLQEIHIHIMT